MTIGEKIRNARQNSGYTQEQLAERLSVSRQAIAKWESDRGIPDIENLKAIASFFDFSLDDLVNEDIQTNPEAANENQPIYAFENSSCEENNDPAPTDSPYIFKNKKIVVPLLSGIAALILMLIVFLGVVPSVKQSGRMREAEKLMNSGNYIAAAEIYEKIDTTEAQEKYNTCIYLYSKDLYNKGDYEAAISYIEDVSYKDSSELSKRWKYEFALLNVKNENYSKAIELFKELGEYNDSESKREELCNYYGTKLYNEKNFKEAVSFLSKISKTSDLYTNVAETYQKASYNYTVDLHNDGKYGTAYNRFKELAKEGNSAAAERAAEILLPLLKQANLWEYHPQDTEITVSYIFHNDKFYLYHINPDGSIKNSLSFYGNIVKNDCVMLGTNTTNSSDIGIFTFDFYGNTEVYIDCHIFPNVDKCTPMCGKYTADKLLTSAAYTKRFEYDFEVLQMPKLSFAEEVSNPNLNNNEQKGEDKTNSEDTSSDKNNDELNSSSQPSNNNASTSNPSSATQPTSKPTENKDPCANGHSWMEATCTTPDTCSVCKKTSGKALGHEIYIAKCTACGQTDYSKLAGTYTDAGGFYSGPYEELEMSPFKIDSQGILSFEIEGQKYSLKVVQVNTSHYDEESNFVCYSLNGSKEPDAKVRVTVNNYVEYPSNEPFTLFIFHFNWEHFNGRDLYFSGEKRLD